MGIAFLLGNTTVIQRKFDPEDWLRVLEKHRVTSTFSAPTPIRRIVSLPDEIKNKYDRSSLRIMIANAAPWPFPLKQAYVRDFPPESLWEVYGSTELGVNMVLEPKDQMRKPGSCGKPAPMVEVRLLDDDGKEVTEPRVPGEVFISSASIFDTYHKAHDKYEADMRGRLHTVGDVAYRDEEGFYFICDRKKDMIISGGVNIYPAEIEAALEACPAIYEAAVFGIPSEEWGESVHAVVVAAPGSELDADGVMAYAREHLAGYKVPRSVSFMDELPKVPSGKILKRELREPVLEGTRDPGMKIADHAADTTSPPDGRGRVTSGRRASGAARSRAHLAGDRRLRRRHHDRVVRLLHLRKSRHRHLAALLSQGQRHPGADRLPLDLRGRVRGAPVRRPLLRPHRRPGRAQARVPGHAADHGRRDRRDRVPADLRHHRHGGADRAAPDPRAPGSGAGRRVRRRGGLRRRARARRPARLLHQLHPDHGHAGALRLARR